MTVRPVATSGTPQRGWPQHDRHGSWLIDDEGNRLLAWHVSGGVFNLGFGDSAMASAVAATVRAHDTGLWSMRSERRLVGEEHFARFLPESLPRSYFTPSASEAFEVACKLAKRHTGRSGLVSVTGGYYGAIGFALAMDDPALQPERYTPMAGSIPKAQFGSIDSMVALVDESTAAVCIEAIQVPAGVFEPPEGYLRAVRDLCNERGALLIFDEVQGGLLRTGDQWAFERHGVVPDVMITGKGLSGGYYPLGALSCSETLYATFELRPPVHRSSFCGGEIAATIAGRTAERYLDPALRAHVKIVSERLGRGLRTILERHRDVVHEIRGRGLVYGVQLAPGRGGAMARACRNRGLYLHVSLQPETVIVMPPLTTTLEETEEGLAIFEASLADI